jgi:hypothetical protein
VSMYNRSLFFPPLKSRAFCIYISPSSASSSEFLTPQNRILDNNLHNNFRSNIAHPKYMMHNS